QADRTLDLELAGAYPVEAGIRSWRRSLRMTEALQVTETWDLDRAGHQVRLHLMLAQAPEQDGEGGWLLRGPSGAARAVLTLTPDDPAAAHAPAAPVTSAVEHIDLADPILRGVWGDQVTRLLHGWLSAARRAVPQVPIRAADGWKVSGGGAAPPCR